MSKLQVIHILSSFRLPESWHHLSPSSGGQRGQQLLAFTKHEHISEAGVGQSSPSSADAEEAVAQDHCSPYRHGGALREGLVYADELGGRVRRVGAKRDKRRACRLSTRSSAALTCSGDIPNDVKSILVNRSG